MGGDSEVVDLETRTGHLVKVKEAASGVKEVKEAAPPGPATPTERLVKEVKEVREVKEAAPPGPATPTDRLVREVKEEVAMVVQGALTAHPANNRDNRAAFRAMVGTAAVDREQQVGQATPTAHLAKVKEVDSAAELAREAPTALLDKAKEDKASVAMVALEEVDLATAMAHRAKVKEEDPMETVDSGVDGQAIATARLVKVRGAVEEGVSAAVLGRTTPTELRDKVKEVGFREALRATATVRLGKVKGAVEGAFLEARFLETATVLLVREVVSEVAEKVCCCRLVTRQDLPL